jgi:hypothetical protein
VLLSDGLVRADPSGTVDDSRQAGGGRAQSDRAGPAALGLILGPIRNLLVFYDELMGDGDPAITRLDEAVAQIKALPAVGGQLGRDLDLIASGGLGADRAQIVAALDRLRYLDSLCAAESVGGVAAGATADPDREGGAVTGPER